VNGWIPDSLFAEFVRRMPICTVDVVLFNPEVTKVLLFRRTNEPLKGQWFTLGGRLLKNETFRECALRQAFAESGLTLAPDSLFFGSVFEEIFERSRFGPDIGCHCVNICWGALISEDTPVRMDAQHDRHEWKSVDDASLDPMLQRKIGALVPPAKQAKERLESHTAL
jgi:colanic acid biosynthesis protein WcaH